MSQRLLILVLIIVLMSTPQSSGESYQKQLEQGIHSLNTGSYEMARKFLEAVVKQSKNQAGVPALIELYRTTGNYEQALALAQSHGTKAAAAEILMYLGRYLQAKNILLQAYALQPDNIAVRFNLGYYYYLTGDKAQYIRYFSRIFDGYDPDREYTTQQLVYIAQACRYYAMKSDEVDRSDTLKTIVQVILPRAIKQDKYCFAAYRQMAELFLDAFNTIDAKATIEEALKLNPQQPELIYCQGLFQMDRYDLRPQAMATLSHALKVNPRLIEALNAATAIFLSDEQYEKADAYFKKALAVNPESLSTLSLLAAMYYMRGRNVAYEQTCKKILAINSKYGELYYTVGEMITHKRQFADSARLSRKAIALDPFLWHAYIALGSNLMRLGKVEEAEKYFKRIEQEYNFHTQTHNMLLLLKKYREYKVYQTEHFTLRLHISESEAILPILTHVLENAYRTVTQRYGFQPKTPVLYELFITHDDFSVRTIGLDSLGASGACFGEVIVGVSPKNKKLGYFNWASVAWHEFAHVVTLQMTNYQIPRWFTEGLSEFTEKQRNPACERKLDMHLFSAYSAGQMRGIATFNVGFTRPKYALEIAVCYYQAQLICSYISQTFGFDKIIQMLLLYRQEKKDSEVFRIALGLSLDEFDKQFTAWLQKNVFAKINVFPSINNKTLDDLRDRVEENPRDSEAYTKLAIGYLQRRAWTDAEIYAGQLSQLLPSQPVAYDILGQISFHRNDNAKAKKLLEKAVTMGSKNFDTHWMLGMIYWHKERNGIKAIKAFKMAQQSYSGYVGPNNTYQKLAEIYTALGQKAKAVAQLEAYLARDEKDFKTRMKLAKEYSADGKHSEALRLLKQAQDIDSLDLELQESLGNSYKIAQQWGAAVTAYQIALDLKPKKGKHRIYTDLAEIYLIQKEYRKAKFCAEEALRIKPGFTRAQKVLDQIK